MIDDILRSLDDVNRIEREAYVAGNITLATLAANLQDAQEMLAETEKAAEEEINELADKILDLEHNISDAKTELRRLYELLRTGPRISGREDLIAVADKIRIALGIWAF